MPLHLLQHHLLKWHFVSKINWVYLCGLFWGSLYYTIIIAIKSALIWDRLITLPFFFFFKIVLALLRPVPLPINFKISLSLSTKNPTWHVERNCIKSVDRFGEN